MNLRIVSSRTSDAVLGWLDLAKDVSRSDFDRLVALSLLSVHGYARLVANYRWGTWPDYSFVSAAVYQLGSGEVIRIGEP